ncbi:MAG: hypothetical protein KME20_01620 [Kaiparowitsia implicata GSE-PSE-MK54-09C]|jgi:hypothetical protein|nr:hypothetical protein [Kaiparowitsia implicata GSE-PSE-MK54-09C]
MVHPTINNISRQARQGSVSAIIQILNEQLADSGVRTRAMLDDGVLQLLCEAARAELLEQEPLVERIRQMLEAIAPRNIRRVNINSRIVKEQQLLWLDEIKRNPDKELLWQQEIKLTQPNPIKRMLEDRKLAHFDDLADVPKSARTNQRDNRSFWRGIVVGGISLAGLLVLVGWAVSNWLGLDVISQLGQSPPSPETPAPAPANQPDPFVQAVRLAEQAAQEGQTAVTVAEWLEIAGRWQRASDLMAQVAESDGRYPTAQDRRIQYAQNSRAALQQAETASDDN